MTGEFKLNQKIASIEVKMGIFFNRLFIFVIGMCKFNISLD